MFLGDYLLVNSLAYFYKVNMFSSLLLLILELDFILIHLQLRLLHLLWVTLAKAQLTT